MAASSQMPVSGISFIGSTSATVSSGGNSDITLPPHQENDFILVLTAKDSSTGDVSPTTSGYTIRLNLSGTSPDSNIHYKFAGASETLNVQNTSLTQDAAVVVYIVRGVDQTNPFDLSAAPTPATGNGDPDCPEITTITDGCMILAIGAQDDDGNSSVSAPSGFGNLEWEATNTSGTSDQATIACSSSIQSTAGAIDPEAYTFGPGDDGWAAVTEALRPA